MWYFMKEKLQVLALLTTAAFILFFELGSGSIFWPYAAEISTDKGSALATVHNWFWTMVVGLLTSYMVKDWLPDGKTFIVFAALSGAGTAYIYFFMKETKGLSERQVKRLYQSEKYLRTTSSTRSQI